MQIQEVDEEDLISSVTSDNQIKMKDIINISPHKMKIRRPQQ